MKETQVIKEIRQKDEKALMKELQDLYQKMTDLRFKASFRRLKNFHEITQTRKKIAQIWTVLNEKALAKLNENPSAKIMPKGGVKENQ